MTLTLKAEEQGTVDCSRLSVKKIIVSQAVEVTSFIIDCSTKQNAKKVHFKQLAELMRIGLKSRPYCFVELSSAPV